MFDPFTWGDFWTVFASAVTGLFLAGMIYGDRSPICISGLVISAMLTITLVALYIRKAIKKNGKRN